MSGESFFGNILPQDSSRVVTPGALARFDDYELDFESRELRCRGDALAISPQAIEVLMVLVAKSGRVVERSVLQEALWREHPASDIEGGLSHAVLRLRKVLNDDAYKPSYIETVHGRGYRLKCRAEWLAGHDESQIPQRSAMAQVAGKIPETLDREQRQMCFRPRWMEDQQVDSMVLSVSDLSDSADDRTWPPLADGVREDLMMLLMGLPENSGLRVIDGLRVPQRSLSMSLEPSPQFELCGSIRRNGQRARVRARLISPGDAVLVGGLSFELDVTNIFSLQQKIAREILEYLVNPLLRSSAQRVLESPSNKDF